MKADYAKEYQIQTDFNRFELGNHGFQSMGQ